MTRICKIFLCATLAVLAVWQLPWCYAFLTTKATPNSFVMYSSLLGDFILTRYEEGEGIVRRDVAGRTYSEAETDSLLPMFYMRQLVADERFPDTLFGVPVSPREVQNTSFNFRMRPLAVNAPQTGIYFLLESMPKRVELEMPDDAFRFTHAGIEFITMETNTVDAEKSARFTRMLTQKGFSFPPRLVSGNPTTMKDYDNGYLLLDARGRLFHLKQTAGQPYVKALTLPEGVKAEHVFLTEFRDRKALGFLTDAEHRLYVVRADGSVVRTGLPVYDPERDDLTIIGNMFDWTVKVASRGVTHYYALRADDYALLKTYDVPTDSGEIFGLSFTSPYDRYVRPRF